MSVIGVKILERRKELGITQEELAAKMGYKSKSSINKIELGVNDIPQSKIVLFAKALMTTPAYLMGWEEQAAADTTEPPAEDPFTDELYKKILLLDDEDKGKVDGFVSGLLATSKYRGEEQTYQIKIAARNGGGVKEITLTESQMAAILNAPEVTELRSDKS